MRALAVFCVAVVLLSAASGSFGRTAGRTWTGTWDTEWGLLTLEQSGSQVTGTYVHDQGRVSGTVSGDAFKGRWTEVPTRKGPTDAGAVELTISADGKTLTGRWNYDGSPTQWQTNWNGTCKSGSCLANTASSARAGVNGAVEPKVWGVDWADGAQALRTESGSRFVYVCPAAGSKAQVWGTGVYTDDSSVCTAALQQDVISYDTGGTVTIEHLPGQASYTGSTKNGITSADWSEFVGSFQIISGTKGGGVPGVKMGGAGWTASAARFRGQNGGRYRYICPGGGELGTIYGTNTYTDDSPVCTAAVHVGLITLASGGRVTITIAPGEKSYRASTFNGVQAQNSANGLGSFTLVGAPVLPGGGGGPGGPTTTTTTSSGGAAAPATGTATGTVLVNGKPFTSGTIPFGATVDVTNGSLNLTTGTGHLAVSGQGVSANFKLVRGTDRKKPIVELNLVKGNFGVCPKRRTRSAGAAPPTTVRQLWGNGKGVFRTNGRYASAAVRGTWWLTADRCDGTFVAVRRGVVEVNDRPQHRQVTVRASHSYLAQP